MAFVCYAVPCLETTFPIYNHLRDYCHHFRPSQKAVIACVSDAPGLGGSIEPHHIILRLMINRFENSLPLGIAHVNLRMHEAENEILSKENFGNGLSTLRIALLALSGELIVPSERF
jgi:hypothetical protein